MTDRSLGRRSFLGALVGAFLAGCSSDAADPTSTISTPPSTEPTSTAPTSTTTPTPAPPTDEALETIEAPEVALPEGAFGLGVASGEPDHDSVVLWTRLVGDLPPSFEMVWELAVEPDMTTLLATGIVTVDETDAHSVRVVARRLPSDQRLFYRFRAGALRSPVGSTRTMPGPGTRRPVTFGVSSCQARTDGAWAAHRDLAAADVDAVLWLGDYIYGDHRTLDDYRAAYAEYRSDPLLSACHAAHPWISFIDDHEVLNDFDASVDTARRHAALRAWWEHQPTRLPAPEANTTYPIHRSFDLGGTVRIVGLDVRQYADDTTLLGTDQWAFVERALQHDGDHTLIASPVVMSGLRGLEGEPLVPYSIDARPEERSRMASLLASAPNPTIVSGDLHTSLVADFSADPLDRASPDVAVEIMAPAISSAFPDRFAALAPFLPIVNPQLRSVEVENGWLELRLGEGERAAVFHFVDDVADPDSTIRRQPIADLTP